MAISALKAFSGFFVRHFQMEKAEGFRGKLLPTAETSQVELDKVLLQLIGIFKAFLA